MHIYDALNNDLLLTNKTWIGLLWFIIPGHHYKRNIKNYKILMLMYVSEINLFLKVLVLLLTFLKKRIKKSCIISKCISWPSSCYVIWLSRVVLWLHFPSQQELLFNFENISQSIWICTLFQCTCLFTRDKWQSNTAQMHNSEWKHGSVEHPEKTEDRSIQVFQFTYVSEVLCHAILQNVN